MDVKVTPLWMAGRREVKITLVGQEIDKLVANLSLRNDDFSKELKGLLTGDTEQSTKSKWWPLS